MVTHQGKQNWPRVLVYSVFSIATGMAIYWFIHRFFRYVEYGSNITFVTYAAHVLLFGSISYFLARRFDSRALHLEQYPYVMSILLVLPTMIFIISRPPDGLLPDKEPVLFFIILAASMLGTAPGIKQGLRIRNYRLDKLGKDIGTDS